MTIQPARSPEPGGICRAPACRRSFRSRVAAVWLMIGASVVVGSLLVENSTLAIAQERGAGFDVGSDPEVLAAISKAMDNPISELLILQTQLDLVQLRFPGKITGRREDEWGLKLSLIPTVPVPLGPDVNWVSRLVLPIVSAPLKKEVGNLFQLDPSGQPSRPPDSARSLLSDVDPFGRTTGLGDLAYIGVLGPRSPPDIAGGKLIWGVGPTFLFPTATEKVLGQGKWQAGPAVVGAYLSEHWTLGLFPQQWFSFAGDDRRQDTSQLNLQYFAYYAPSPDWSIGASPNVFVNWKAKSGDKLTLPVGIGVNKTFFLGKLPVRIGAEVYYSAVHPDDTPGTRWAFRFLFVPVVPAPWGELGKALRKTSE